MTIHCWLIFLALLLSSLFQPSWSEFVPTPPVSWHPNTRHQWITTSQPRQWLTVIGEDAHHLTQRSFPFMEDDGMIFWGKYHTITQHMAVCQNLVPLVNIKIAGKWMFIPLKMVLIGIDPYPYHDSIMNN